MGADWKGVAREYRGTPPWGEEIRYLVLCLENEGIWISFTLTADEADFVANEGLYRWLITTQLFLRAPWNPLLKEHTEILQKVLGSLGFGLWALGFGLWALGFSFFPGNKSG